MASTVRAIERHTLPVEPDLLVRVVIAMRRRLGGQTLGEWIVARQPVGRPRTNLDAAWTLCATLVGSGIPWMEAAVQTGCEPSEVFRVRSGQDSRSPAWTVIEVAATVRAVEMAGSLAIGALTDALSGGEMGLRVKAAKHVIDWQKIKTIDEERLRIDREKLALQREAGKTDGPSLTQIHNGIAEREKAPPVWED